MEEIDILYRWYNADVPAPDMGRTAKALARFLKDNPSWTFARIRRCMRNRYWSEGVNYGEAAWMWIKYLAMYADDPLDSKRRPKIGLGDGVEKWWESQKKAVGSGQ
jgi:hypothetical protein